MNLLIVVNDAPYGAERAYNALRLAAEWTIEADTVLVF